MSGRETYKVRVTKDYLVFSAAHFITFNGNQCERLHGHNYRVTACVSGPLDENHYVVDFILLRDKLREIVADLDHFMLLPMRHPLIHVKAVEGSVEVTFENRRWVFPRGDCVLLPIENTTAERLAHYIAGQLKNRLSAQLGNVSGEISIEVDECEGQSATCTIPGE